MDGKKFLIATVAGAITLFIMSAVLWGLLFMDFFVGHSTADVMYEVPVLWAMILSQLCYAALLTVIIRWAGATGAGPGLKTAALVGLLMALAADLMIFATADLMDLTATLVDPVLVAIQSGIAGAVIGWLLGRGGETAAA